MDERALTREWRGRLLDTVGLEGWDVGLFLSLCIHKVCVCVCVYIYGRMKELVCM